MKKFLLVGFIFMMCLGLVSCKKADIHDNCLNVFIKPEYKEQFLNKTFKIEDFGLENIDRIEYSNWGEEIDTGIISVYLKIKSIKNVKKAVKHCKKLYFVKDARPIGLLHTDN